MVSSGWVSNLPSIQLIINFTAKNQSQGKNAPVVCLLCWFGTITVSHRLQTVTETLKKVEWPSGWGTRDDSNMSFKFHNSSQYFIINWSALLTYKQMVLGLKPPDSRGFSGFHFQSDSAGAPPSCLRLQFRLISASKSAEVWIVVCLHVSLVWRPGSLDVPRLSLGGRWERLQPRWMKSRRR